VIAKPADERALDRRKVLAEDDRLLLTVPQAARILSIGTTLAYELVGRGVLPHVRLGRALRVPRATLEAWVAANTIATPRMPGSTPESTS
jgi:excisionase family DNA binding protein